MLLLSSMYSTFHLISLFLYFYQYYYYYCYKIGQDCRSILDARGTGRDTQLSWRFFGIPMSSSRFHTFIKDLSGYPNVVYVIEYRYSNPQQLDHLIACPI